MSPEDAGDMGRDAEAETRREAMKNHREVI